MTDPTSPAPASLDVVWENAAKRVGEELAKDGPTGYYGFTADQWRDWALSALVLTREQQAQPCVWTEDSSGDYWESACGETWTFDDGGPAENKARFCHGCGHPLKAVNYIDACIAEDDDL